MSELFNQGGIVMLLIAAVSVAAWLLAFETWWTAKLMLTDLTEELAHKSRREKTKFVFENELTRLEGSLNLLAGLAAALPLLGLLGTVLGMLVTFNVIQSHGTGRPGLLANGIRQALLTTQAGLLTALPVLFFHHLISMRLRKIGGELNLVFHGSETMRKNSVQEKNKT
jgi:biopolymer transport protein ExbB/TolQ